MNKKTRLFSLLFLLFVFLTRAEANLNSNFETLGKSEKYVEITSDISTSVGENDFSLYLNTDLRMAKKIVKKDTYQYFKLNQAFNLESLELVIKKDGSDSIKKEICIDDIFDSGIFRLKVEETGFYEVLSINLNGEEIKLDNYDFQVIDNPLSYFNQETYPIVDETRLASGEAVGRRDLLGYLSNLSLYNEDLEELPFEVSLIQNGENYNFKVTKDNFYLSSDLIPGFEFELGKASLIIKSGDKTIERDINFVENSSLITDFEKELEVSNFSRKWGIERIAGDTRFKTAIEISKQSYEHSENIVLVNGFNFPDALAAGPLALSLKAPILFTEKTSLNTDTLSEIARLSANNIYIVGGNSVVGIEVEEELKSLGYNVCRKGGEDRFLTSVEIAKELLKEKASDTAVICYFNNFPDALSISSYASSSYYPILFTETERLNNKTLEFLKEQSSIKKVKLIGGVNVLSDIIIDQLHKEGFQTDRIFGCDRYETSKNIALRFFPNSEKMLVASGQNFPDALAAGVYAAKKNLPLLISETNNLNYYICDLLGQDYNNQYEMLELFPGEKYTTKRAPFGEYSLSKYKYVTFIGGNSALRNYLGSQAQRYIWKNWARKNKVDIKISTNKYDNPKDTKNIKKSDLDRPTVYLQSRTASVDKPIRILLDPGHGWNYNAGVISGYYEGINTYYYAKVLEKELKKYGFDVAVTRTWPLETERRYCNSNSLFSTDGVTLAARGNMAEDYDLFLSIHSNATGRSQASGSVRGTEVYDSVTNPNKELANKIGNTIASSFGHEFRGVIYRKDYYKGLGTVNDNWYGVLRNSKARHSMLLEHGYHDNYNDCSLFMSSSFQKSLAKNVAKTLADYYGQY